MSSYIPQSAKERAQMLEVIGIKDESELFSSLPESVREEKFKLPDGMSEMEVSGFMENIADKNVRFRSIFRGAGSYDRYIPSIVGSVTGKEEFLTAYTPYQAEISQGILQSIFEYQTMICRLTGLDVANASLYDGAEAAAEAVAMCRERKRDVAYISEAANPMVIDTIKAYCFGNGMEMKLIPMKDGLTDISALAEMLGDSAACVYVQQPNYFGVIEDISAVSNIAHNSGAKMIVGAEPIAMSVLKTPAELGADICVGEGQPLGMPMAFGGPYLGFMAVTNKLMRKMPGRIVGETTDKDGKRAFVLTLQAREQHIRREKAGSNICSNEALCALTASVYMAAMGDRGMSTAAKDSYGAAHYLSDKLNEIGYKNKYTANFFNEFVTASAGNTSKLLRALESRGILGGLPLSDGDILWCCTEKNTMSQINEVISVAKEVM